jgi:hypothetical protein
MLMRRDVQAGCALSSVHYSCGQLASAMVQFALLVSGQERWQQL